MGKVSERDAVYDGKQTTISSFFKTKEEEKRSRVSPLFTSIRKTKPVNKLSLKNTSACSESRATISKKNPDNNGSFASMSGAAASISKSTSLLTKNICEITSTSAESMLTCAPEMQLLESQTCQTTSRENESVKNASAVIRDEIIPDTPDSDNAMSKKKFSGRSFLMPVSRLSSRPAYLSPTVRKVHKPKPGRNLEDALKESNPSELEKVELSSLGLPGLNTLQQSCEGLSVITSTMKRSPNRTTGESPVAKRTNRDTAGEIDRGRCKTRLKLGSDETTEMTNEKISGLKGSELASKLKMRGHSKTKLTKIKPIEDVIVNEDSSDSVLEEILSDLKNVSEGIASSQKRNPFYKSKQTANFTKTITKTKYSSEDNMISSGECNSLFEKTAAVLTKNKTSMERESQNKFSLTDKSCLAGDEVLSELLGELHSKSEASSKYEPHIQASENSKCSGNFASDVTKETVVRDLCLQDNSPTSAIKQLHIDDFSQQTNPSSEGCIHKELLNEGLNDSFWESSPVKSQQSSSVGSTDKLLTCNFGRHIVQDVHQENAHSDIILTLESEGERRQRWCTLAGFWSDTMVEVGDIVHVLGDFDSDNCITVDDLHNFIIVNPDLLISGTSVVSTVFCLRKTVLNEKFRGYECGNIQMLLGSILHCLFQQALKLKQNSTEDLMSLAKDLLKGFLHEMYAQELQESILMGKIVDFIPFIQQWIQKHTSGNKAHIKSTNANPHIEVSKVADIEENIWSPRYGIKGKIDLTVEVNIHKPGSIQKKVVPLELKTGKASYSIEHKGQVTLYCMMSGDRRVDPEEGLLYYLKEGSMKSIPAEHSSKKGLIQLRNELAYYMSHSLQQSKMADKTVYQSGNLPKPINNERFCGKCPHRINCALYQTAIEDYTPPPGHCMETIVPLAIAHLKPSHLTYFKHWCLLLHMEMTSSHRSVKDIWCCTAEERERKGECFSGLGLLPRDESIPDDKKQIHVFARHAKSTLRCSSLLNVGLCNTDPIVVSTSDGKYIAVSSGAIVQITENSVSVLLDRDLHLNPDLKSSIYRLDKAEYYSTMASNFTQLSRLMEDSEKSQHLRELIIDRKLPAFEKTMSKGAIEKVKDVFKPLNKPQKSAVLRALLSRDYVLIKGFPGAGKTSTIVALIRILVTLGQSVLLTSYTHSAVDNILLKLKQHTSKFIRLGRCSRIHPDIRPYSAELQTRNMDSVNDMATFYSSKAVVATTCLGITHPIFARRRFDVCIVDEATQVLQPACLGPLFVARKFVLVGDPKQLPPVVQNKDARSLGMDKSVFSRLDDTGATYELDLQYRMNSEIMRLCNELVYNGCLKCGTPEVATATLNINTDITTASSPAWMYEVLSANLEHSVVFLDTEKVDASESRDGQQKLKNEGEAHIVQELTQQFTQAGICSADIGIITPYRNQVKVIKDTLEFCHLEDVEVNTVDTYQGRDKNVIIMSFVRTSDSEEVHAGEILQDWRRLNVAVTRAKHKLVMIGRLSALRQFKPVEKLINCLNPHQIYFSV